MGRLSGKKVAVLVANGFEQVEMEKPREALEKEGARTFVISPEKNVVQGWHHMEKGKTFTVDVNLSQANASDYDALLLPGGVFNPDLLRLEEKAIEFVKEMHQHKKPLAAICHGPWLLINAEIVDGLRLTSWPSIKQDLVNAGANWVDETTVCENKVLTSRKPEDIPQFNSAMIELFAQG